MGTTRTNQQKGIYSINYLCASWQGFLQQVVYQIARGYHHHCLTRLSEDKRDKWPLIDQKLIYKYQSVVSKDQRYRIKRAGRANVIYLRWEHCALLLMTDGAHGDLDDRFCYINATPLTIQVSPIIGLKIHYGAKGVTVHLAKDSYQGLKTILWDAARLVTRNPDLLKREFDKLNGLPCWGGIIEQKRQLLDYALTEAKRQGCPLKRDEFRLNTRRHIYQVWARD